VRFLTRTSLALASLFMASCRDNGVDDSADVSTRDIQIVVQVNGKADRTEVRAYASALLPYSGALTLTGGDELLLHDEGRLEREAGTAWYVRASSRDRGRFSVDLRRPSDRPLADLGIDVPPPFTLRSSATRAKWSERIELTWDRADGEHGMSIEVEGECIRRFVHQLQKDTGAYTLNGGELARLDPTAPCAVSATVVRTGPSISSRTMFARASAERTVELTLDP
jgi:hypothetical protein